jgi:hypothetical protein
MGWKLRELPDRVKNKIAGRPRHKAWRTFAEAEDERVFRLELELHNQYRAFLNRNGFEDVQYSNPHKRTTVKAGTPDFLVTRNSRRLAIEFKIPPNKLSPAQETFFAMAERQANRCAVCYDLASAIRITVEFFELIIWQ